MYLIVVGFLYTALLSAESDLNMPLFQVLPAQEPLYQECKNVFDERCDKINKVAAHALVLGYKHRDSWSLIGSIVKNPFRWRARCVEIKCAHMKEFNAHIQWSDLKFLPKPARRRVRQALAQAYMAAAAQVKYSKKTIEEARKYSDIST